jgi:deoxyribonuclease-4
MGIPAAQIFTSNPRQYSEAKISSLEALEFRSYSGGITFMSHGSYLINPGSPREDVLTRSMNALKAELERCARLGVPFCVLHPGSAVGGERNQALARAASSIRSVLEEAPPGVTLLLENTSGAGDSLGGDFLELRGILNLIDLPGRTGVCLDTAHAHGFGYRLDSRESALEFCNEAEGVFGESLRAFHINDSKVERGSRKDRHANAGMGFIGLSSLAAVAFHQGFSRVPGILETPGEDGDRLEDIRRITREHEKY